MIVEFSDELQISKYEHGYRLERARSRNGQVTFEPFKWYPDLCTALEGAGRQVVLSAETLTLGDELNAISQAAARINEIVDQVISSRAQFAQKILEAA